MKKFILFILIFNLGNQVGAKEAPSKEQIANDVLGLRFNDFSNVEVQDKSISLEIYGEPYVCKSEITYSADIKHKNSLIYKVSISNCKKAGRSNRLFVSAEVRANQKNGDLFELQYQLVEP